MTSSEIHEIPRGDPRVTRALASAFTIQDRLTSARRPWVPNEEQETLWALMSMYLWLFIAKSRKIGTSTAGEFDDLLWTNAADRSGNRVRAVFAIDTDPKALEHLERCADWAHQKKMSVKPRYSAPYALVFPKAKARLEFLTLGSEEPGRGGDIHRLHLTELPYAANPERAYHALRSACADNAHGLIETTMTSADAFTIDLWRGQRRDPSSKRTVPIGTEFHRHFFRVTDQRSYRLRLLEVDDKRSVHAIRVDREWVTRELTDADWRYCRGEGFPDTVDGREAAAWWWLYALPTLAQGDLLTLMHDYPQLERHLFVATTARAITVTPRIAIIVDTITLAGVGGNTWTMEIYVPPRHTSGQHFVVVDTAFAKGKSNSVVLVVDISDGRICACFCSSLIETDDLARMAQLAREHYLRSDVKGTTKRRADVIIEDDGVGGETCKDSERIGLAYQRFSQATTSARYGGGECVKAAKRMIEAVGADGQSMVAGPVELVDEAEKLRKTEDGFEGYKDVIMCLGMAAVRRREQGMRDSDKEWKKQRKDPMRVYEEDRMREQARLYRGEGHYGRRV